MNKCVCDADGTCFDKTIAKYDYEAIVDAFNELKVESGLELDYDEFERRINDGMREHTLSLSGSYLWQRLFKILEDSKVHWIDGSTHKSPYSGTHPASGRGPCGRGGFLTDCASNVTCKKCQEIMRHNGVCNDYLEEEWAKYSS